MKIIDLEQGSPEWLSWRKTVITATEASVILGNNPWVTPYKCWQRKLGLIEEQQSNEAMERGKKLEPEARSSFIEKYGIEMKPAVVESSDFQFLGASLDGLSDCQKYVLEIKCGGYKLHEMASKGEIPQYYLDQMQHQLLVTGAEKCFYYSYNGKEGICIEVIPDSDFKAKFLSKARDFWRCVAFSEPPDLKDSDYKDMNENADLGNDLKIYKELDEAIKVLEEKKDFQRKKIIDSCGDQSSICQGVKIMKIITKGRIAYDEIPELKSVDLEKYRKSSMTGWKILAS